MATQGMGELSNLNGIGTSIKLYPSHSICYLIGVLQTTPNPQDKRCKQIYGWHINIPYIFMTKIDILFILFGFVELKI